MIKTTVPHPCNLLPINFSKCLKVRNPSSQFMALYNNVTLERLLSRALAKHNEAVLGNANALTDPLFDDRQPLVYRVVQSPVHIDALVDDDRCQ